HSMMIKKAEDLLWAVPMAFKIAVSGRPGPVLIDVPRDIQLKEVEFESWPDVKKENENPLKIKFLTPQEELEEAAAKMAETLLSSTKCAFYLGGGCNDEKASELIKELLEHFDAAVVTSLMGIGAYPVKKENNMGMVGMHGSLAAARAMHEADVVLALGVRFDDRATGVISKFCPDAKILHIDIDAAEINKILPSYVCAVSDVKDALPLLIKKMNKMTNTPYYGECKIKRYEWLSSLIKLKEETDSLLLGRPASADGINPRAFIKEIPEAASKAGLSSSDIIVTTDVGQHQMWSAQYYPVERARQFLTSGSLGTMGFGLPAAIGAALANPDKRIVCISGDGSILMNVQELATLSELDLNVTVIVFKNGSLGMVRQQQEYIFNKNYSASIFQKVPDFLKVAEGFGIRSIDAGSDKSWYNEAFKKGPCLVKVDIAMEENVLPFVKAGSANIDALRN
ncbi:MAG: acetolactate synthase large subunit, partial [Treponema sp.]|nr:acetolactate synthase large subunit [Treponema sp.]